MKNVLILYPHWPPSNLVGVHRVRLVANNLAHHGWHPVVLTVNEDYYEEPGSTESIRLVNETVEVIKVTARAPWSLFGKRIVGDIGLRAFRTLNAEALRLCRDRSIDFLWISMPSWYPSLMGKSILKQTGVPFGIDYQDPWVQPLPAGTKAWSRAAITQRFASMLEPLALRNASLISGINRPYFQGALDRNPLLQVHTAAFQLGFDAADHAIDHPTKAPWPEGKLVALYPGAFLPLSAPFHRIILQAFKTLDVQGKLPTEACMVYIGTGHAEQPIKSIAEELGIAHRVIELPDRIPYLEVQQLLRSVHGCMVIGSPEPHYSASKVFQSILSGRPILSLLHKDSEALHILEACQCGAFSLGYTPDDEIQSTMKSALQAFWDCTSWTPQVEALEPHSARNAAATLAEAMNQCLVS